MDNDNILSLCVSVIINSGQARLLRIADLEHDELIPYNIDYAVQRGGTNVDLIFHPDISITAEGTISFWEWYSPDGVRQLSYHCKDTKVSWIEHIRLDSVSSAEELRVALFNDIGAELTLDHDYLIEFSNNSYNISRCVYCKSDDFILRNNKYILRDNLYLLDYFEISYSDIHDIRTNHIPKMNKRYYGYLGLPQKSGSLLVRSPADTVKQAIQKRIQRCTEGFSKADKKTISDFVRNLTTESIVKHIADECRCTIEDAHEYIVEFITVCERYFADDDIASSVLLHLIEYNSEIGKKYQEEVQEEWERQNAERIACAKAEEKRVTDRIEMECQKADSELSATKNRLDDLLLECEEYEKLKLDIETNANELQKEYDYNLSVADGIAKQVRDKIAAAKSDLSAFFAEYTLFAGERSFTSTQITGSSDVVVGNLITEAPEIITDVNELLDCLKENLNAVGVDKLHCSALGAYLLAAYFARVPLTIAGYGAEAIINAVSATLCNKEADKIYAVTGSLIVENMDSDIVAVYNGFCSMGNILSSAKSSYFYFVSQTSEELMLEPRSSYNYALPIFTEYFITDHTNGDLFGTICDVRYSGGDKVQKPYFPTYIVPPLAFNNYKTLLGMSAKLYNNITPYHIHLLTTLPIMLSLNKREELLELLSSATLSDKDKEKIYMHMGERR